MKFIRVTNGTVRTLLNVDLISAIQVEEGGQCCIRTTDFWHIVEQDAAQVHAMINLACVYEAAGDMAGSWVVTTADLPKDAR